MLVCLICFLKMKDLFYCQVCCELDGVGLSMNFCFVDQEIDSMNCLSGFYVGFLVSCYCVVFNFESDVFYG